MIIKYVVLSVLCVLLLPLQACSYNKVSIMKQADGEKEININIIDDPLVLAVDLKSYLIKQGFKVSIRKNEMEESVKNSGSNLAYRYELLVGYNVQPALSRVTMVSASVIDYQSKQVLGSWQSSINSHGREGLIERLDKYLLSQVFGLEKVVTPKRLFPRTRHYTVPGF